MTTTPQLPQISLPASSAAADAAKKQTAQHQLWLAIALACSYISLTLFANIGSLRVLLLFGLAADGGTLLYPFTFTLRDILHKKLGAATTRFIIVLSAIINLLLFLFIYLVSSLPADPSAGDQAAFAQVLNPGIRLVAGSLLGMTVAELSDTTLYSLVRRRWGRRRQYLRVLLSNALSIPLDTLIFILVAFAGRYTAAVLWEMFWANLIIKYLISLLSVGGVYLVRDDRD